VLAAHRWPGNVRELENVIYRSAVIAQGDTILPKDLPIEIRGPVRPHAPFEAPDLVPVGAQSDTTAGLGGVGLDSGVLSVATALDFLHAALNTLEEPILARVEREMVVRALAAAEGNQAKAAERLGMTRTTLRKRIEAYGLKL
jgi:DNA-binding NtrC family response regulator